MNEWQHNTQDEGTLLRGALLVEAERWLTQKADMLTDEEKDYIRHSVEARERAVQAEQQRAEYELAQAKRLAEEAAKREEAERARAAAAERARRRQRYFSLVLLILFGAAIINNWLWRTGYTFEQAGLKLQSVFVSIHVLPPQMMEIPAGTFQMGDVEGLQESSSNPVHPVTIKPFRLGKYEVTFDEYDRFAIATGRRLPEDQEWGRGQRPVINVSWEDAKAYAEWLSAQTGQRYRLPTESEWEYAARSGASQQVWAGTSNEAQLGEYAVFRENSEKRTAEVGTKTKNSFGLYDLSGNVWEWGEDCAHSTYDDAPTDGSAWLETNEGNCGRHAIRGGSWLNLPLGVSYRDWFNAGSRFSHIGFRLAQDLEP